jgi:hypothetical protein
MKRYVSIRRKAITVVTFVALAALLSYVSIAVATLTFTGSTLLGDGTLSIDNVGALTIGNTSATAISVGKSGILTTLLGIASSSELRSPSSTFTTSTIGTLILTNPLGFAYGGTATTTSFSSGYLLFSNGTSYAATSSIRVSTSTAQMLQVFGVASSTEVRTPSSTITTLTVTTCIGCSSGTPATPIGSIQYNESGVLAGTSSLMFATSTMTLHFYGVASSTELRTPSSTIGGLAFTNATGTTLTISSLASSSQFRSPSSTIDGLAFTNATGTTLTISSVVSSSELRSPSSTIGTLAITGHTNATGTAPTSVTLCGTPGQGTVAGTDYAGVITTGAAATSSCTLTFSATYSSSPVCVLSNQSNASTSLQAITTPTTLLIYASSSEGTVAFNSNNLAYICIGTNK